MIKSFIKKLIRRIYLYDFALELLSNIRRTKHFVLWHVKRDLEGVDRKIMERYFSEYEIRKLHIGCGKYLLNGWLNTDFYPEATPDALSFDATKRFPFQDCEFDYIFSEHMIEHITYAEGLQMLSECYRVLKPHGKLRIVTPNLSFVIDLYRTDKSELQCEYIEWWTNHMSTTYPYESDTFIINNFVRDWGHKFIYDEKTLSRALKDVGFTGIVKFELHDSEDAALRNLENINRQPSGFLNLESIALEAIKL